MKAPRCCRRRASGQGRVRRHGPVDHRTHLETVFINLTGKDLNDRRDHRSTRRDRPARRRHGLRFRALLSRTSTYHTELKEFIPRNRPPPLLLVFVFTYVFPKIRQASARRPGPHSSRPCSWPGCSHRSCSRASSLRLMVQEFGYTKEIEDASWRRSSSSSPSRRSSPGHPVPHRGGHRLPDRQVRAATPVHLQVDWRCCSPWRRSPAPCPRSGDVRHLVDPRRCRCCSASSIPSRSWAASASRGRSRVDQVAADPRARQPAGVHEQGFRAALTPVRHMSLWPSTPLIGFTVLFTGRPQDLQAARSAEPQPMRFAPPELVRLTRGSHCRRGDQVLGVCAKCRCGHPEATVTANQTAYGDDAGARLVVEAQPARSTAAMTSAGHPDAILPDDVVSRSVGPRGAVECQPQTRFSS